MRGSNVFSVAQLYFQSDDFRGDVILHAAFAHPALKCLVRFECGRDVPCVLTTVPILSPGISSVVSTNAMVLIIDLVRSPETSALFYLSYPPLPRDPFITGRLSRSSVCIFYPNRRGKDRCARFFCSAWR
jgi:hypothetical protein